MRSAEKEKEIIIIIFNLFSQVMQFTKSTKDFFIYIDDVVDLIEYIASKHIRVCL